MRTVAFYVLLPCAVVSFAFAAWLMDVCERLRYPHYTFDPHTHDGCCAMSETEDA